MQFQHDFGYTSCPKYEVVDALFKTQTGELMASMQRELLYKTVFKDLHIGSNMANCWSEIFSEVSCSHGHFHVI